MKSERYDRQSFLGEVAQDKIETTTVGVVGAGGGGSHIVQQLSHVGFLKTVVFDEDYVSESNLNRNVGSRAKDVVKRFAKVLVSKRLMRDLHPGVRPVVYQAKWEKHPDALRRCDIIVSCVDSFPARRDLEAEARRNLIPLIDIGIDVHPNEQGPPSLVGQVILSMPGYACMQCLGFLSDDNLAKEAQGYGTAAGSRPQVVWPNGIVASFAVDLVVDLVTDWTGSIRGPVYLSYDGNRRTVSQNNRLLVAPKKCDHYPVELAGAPVFRPL